MIRDYATDELSLEVAARSLEPGETLELSFAMGSRYACCYKCYLEVKGKYTGQFMPDMFRVRVHDNLQYMCDGRPPHAY